MEAFAAVNAAVRDAPRLRGRNVLWVIDNTSVLFAMLKGSSPSESVDRLALLANLMLARYGVRVYFEYVESEANWSDGVSRHGGEDPLARTHGFSLTRASLCPLTPLLYQPLRDAFLRISSIGRLGSLES